MASLSDIAADLAQHSPVFPCNDLKRPLTANGFKDATRDPVAARQMFSRPGAVMIGMPTGTASGLVVVDVDVKNGAQGDAWLQENAGRLPPTRTHKTRSGGLHLLFRIPAGVEIRNSASRVAPGVDVRGQGGYIVVPPSPGYSVADGTEPAEMPDWLIDRCLHPQPEPPPPHEPRRSERHADSVHGSRYGLAALERECEAISKASPGVQEPALNDGALRMGSLVAAGVLDARYAYDRLVEAGMRMVTGDPSWPWSRSEIADKVERALTDGTARPRQIKEREFRTERPQERHVRQEAPLSERPSDQPNEAPKRDVFPLIRFEDIQPDPDARDFVQGVLTEGGAAVVYGESNAGKTFWTTDLSLHVAAGLQWNGRRVDAGPVIYVALEGASGFRNRVAAWKVEKGMEDASVPFYALIHPINLLDPEADMPRLMETLRQVTDEAGAPKLVVVDTLSRALAGGDENSSEDMGALVRNMDLIRHEIGCCVLFIHHSGKDASKGARGHSLLRAAIDTEIEVKAEEGSSLKTATTVKQRELSKGDVFAFTLRVTEIGVNRHGEPVTTCLVEEANEPNEANEKKRSVRLNPTSKIGFDALRNLIAEKGTSGFGVPDSALSVPEEWFRDRFYRVFPHDSQDAKRMAFNRVRADLVSKLLIRIEGGRSWIV